MSETGTSLRRKIATAGDLHAVVRTMKAMAASQISQYDNAVAALDAYYRTVRLALAACLRQDEAAPDQPAAPAGAPIVAVVFGSDQGMVGQRIAAQLAEGALAPGPGFDLPGSISGTAALVSKLLLALEARRAPGQVYLFHHRPGQPGTYAPVCQRLLPLDDAWRRELATLRWPTNALPEVLGQRQATLCAASANTCSSPCSAPAPNRKRARTPAA